MIGMWELLDSDGAVKIDTMIKMKFRTVAYILITAVVVNVGITLFARIVAKKSKLTTNFQTAQAVGFSSACC